MHYQGKLYGKIAGEYLELEGTAEEFDKYKAFISSVGALRRAQKAHARIADPLTLREKRKHEDLIDKLLRGFSNSTEQQNGLFE